MSTRWPAPLLKPQAEDDADSFIHRLNAVFGSAGMAMISPVGDVPNSPTRAIHGVHPIEPHDSEPPTQAHDAAPSQPTG